ncbi:MAG: hypothetical protein ACYDD1_19940 [Caulobacteraceae bacterium]
MNGLYVTPMARSQPSPDAALIQEADRIVQTLTDETRQPVGDIWRLSADLTVETNTPNGVVYVWDTAEVESVLRLAKNDRGVLTASVVDETGEFVPLNDTDRREWMELLTFIVAPIRGA